MTGSVDGCKLGDYTLLNDILHELSEEVPVNFSQPTIKFIIPNFKTCKHFHQYFNVNSSRWNRVTTESASFHYSANCNSLHRIPFHLFINLLN